MKPIRTEHCNFSLGPPAGWDQERDGECATLHAERALDERRHPIMRTTWVPDAEELAAISAGAPIVLTVWGMSHPPVALEVDAVPVKS